jgi:hypothetical protein
LRESVKRKYGGRTGSRGEGGSDTVPTHMQGSDTTL